MRVLKTFTRAFFEIVTYIVLVALLVGLLGWSAVTIVHPALVMIVGSVASWVWALLLALFYITLLALIITAHRLEKDEN